MKTIKLGQISRYSYYLYLYPVSPNRTYTSLSKKHTYRVKIKIRKNTFFFIALK